MEKIYGKVKIVIMRRLSPIIQIFYGTLLRLS